MDDDATLSSDDESSCGPRPIKSARGGAINMRRPRTTGTGTVGYGRNSSRGGGEGMTANAISSSMDKKVGGSSGGGRFVGGDFIDVSGEKENGINSLPRRPHTKGDTRPGSQNRYLGVTSHKHFDKQVTITTPEDMNFNAANSFMVVEPKKIEFPAIKTNLVYAMTFCVKNCTKIAQRIRIDAPKSPYFALNYIPTASVAPGLGIIAEIECRIPESSPEMSFSDVVNVSLGPYNISIPVLASKHHAAIKFDHLVDLGFIPIGQTMTKEIYFENTGQISTVLQFKPSPKSNFKFFPSELALAPNQRRYVVASFDGREIGSFRDLVTLSIPGGLQDELLDICIQVVNQKLSLISDEKGLLSTVSFGSMFYGQKKVVKAKLVNTGPTAVSYSVYYPDDEKFMLTPNTLLNAAGQDATSCGEKKMIFSSTIGVIQPFSEFPIEISFDPVLFVPKSGFTSQFQNEVVEAKTITRKAIIDSQQLSERVEVLLQATVMQPNIEVSHDFLDFGDCPYNDRRDILITITNKSPLKTSYEFGRSAQFAFNPSKGKINADTTISIVATFKPLQLGIFKTSMPLSIADGLRVYDIRVYGESEVKAPNRVFTRGADKLPEDFEPKYKFVDVEKLAASRREKTLDQTSSLPSGGGNSAGETASQPSLNLIPGMTSQERDDVYDMTAHNSNIMLTEPKIKFDDNHPYKQRLDHEKTYNEFLQTNHKNRLEIRSQRAKREVVSRGGADRSDPWGVDLGMERGLAEPLIPLPVQSDTLWMANRATSEGGKQKVNVDENRLISKKFSNVPATQADLKDCVQELSIEDLTKITVSHKTINFGKVCVNSTVSKNLSFQNDLHHAVMVKIYDLEPELKQSKPDAQIIPKDCTAGFDMYFTGKMLGKYRKVFSYSINSKHTQKIAVVAEIVPIELEISVASLKFEFQNNNLEPLVTKDFVLSNPGNAPASFLWGRSGSFDVKPDRGLIEIGQSALMTATWRPGLGRRNDEQIGLHVTGGVDKILPMEGVMPDCQAVFDVKKINLGVMAVGLTKEVTVNIKNPGNSPTVLYMNTYEAKYGISCTPDRLLVQPGDSMSVNIKIQPKESISYNFNLGATIRGGKSISVKMVGESTIPDITLTEAAFDFGVVATGGECFLPFTLANNSQITSCMMLDLSQYPDFKPFLTAGEEKYPLVPIATSQSDEDGNAIESVTPQGEVVVVDDKKDKQAISNIWKISIQPGSTMRASVIFIPRVAKTFNFQLPLFIWGMHKMSNDSDSGNHNFNVPVTAEALRSRIEISSKIVDFGDRVVSRDPMTRNSYFLEFFVKNVDLKQGLDFELRDLTTTMVSLVADRGGASAMKLPVVEDDGLSVFFIAPMASALSAGSSFPVRITFMPKMYGAYEKVIDIYISGQPDTSRPYLSVIARGCGVFPKISFDRQIVSFPVVPLGVTTRAMFKIFNKGFSSQVLKQTSSPIIPIPLEISFPDGLELNNSIKSLRCIVSWKSNQPVSWAGKLEFSDSNGEKFPIMLSGCTDNCILTNYSFVNNYSDEYGLLGLEHQSTKLYKKTMIAELVAADLKRKEALRKQKLIERQKRMEGKMADKEGGKKEGGKKEKKDAALAGESITSASIVVNDSKLTNAFPEEEPTDGVDLDLQNQLMEQEKDPNGMGYPAYIEADTRVLLSWMNRFVCRKDFAVDNFPQCIIDTNGDLVIDYVEQVSGKPMNGVQMDNNSTSSSSAGGSRPSTSGGSGIISASRVGRLVTKYQSILNSLVRSGALVNHINPITLLGLQDHMAAQEIELAKFIGSRIPANVLDEYKEKWHNEWAQNCKSAWLDILFQILKIYVLSRVSFKDIANMTIPVEGILRTTADNSAAAAGGGGGSEVARPKTSSKKTPSEYTNSNIYSLPELLLFAWSSAHISKSLSMKTDGGAENSDSFDRPPINIKRIADLEVDLKDLYGFCQIIHSNLPSMAKDSLKDYKNVDRSQKQEVFNTLASALRDVRLDWDVSADDFLSSRSMIVMLLHLYINLPSLAPKSTIEFKGMLGAPITKVIELRNPSKKRVTYDVSISGSSEFQPEAKTFSIPPESIYEFKVNFLPRFSECSSAIINFWGVRDGGVAGSNLVFMLKSLITGIQALETIDKTCCLYEKVTLPISIQCPFDQTFQVSMRVISEHNVVSLENLAAEKFNKKTKASGTGTLSDDPDEAEITSLFINPLWCVEQGIILQPNTPRVVNFTAIPIVPGVFKIQILFTDPQVGEFCYAVNLNVGLPQVSDRLELDCYIPKESQIICKALRISSKNQFFDKAVTALVERVTNAAKKVKAKAVLLGLLNSPIENPDTGSSAFCIDLLSPVCSVQKLLPFVSEYSQLTTPTSAQSHGGEKRPTTQAGGNKFKKCMKTILDAPTATELAGPCPNTALVNFALQRAGTYHCKALIYSRDNRNDIRVVEITAVASTAKSQTAIEFKGPARQKFTQEIPINNTSDRDWELAASIVGFGFTGPKSLVIPPRSKAVYILEFCGNYVGRFDGVLNFKNIMTNDVFEYILEGVTDDPLAEDHIVLKCKARSKEFLTIPVFNIPTSKNKIKFPAQSVQTFLIETDIPYMSGKDVVEVPSGETVKYKFSVNPPIGGLISGSINFIDKETGAILWYTVEVEVSSPPPERSIRVESIVRKAAAIELSLDNPTSTVLEFEVKYEGEGLIGDNTFVLHPNGDKVNDVYELIFSPLVSGEFKGKISFQNDKVGIIWYELELISTPAPFIEIEPFECIIGGTFVKQILIENPAGEHVELLAYISDPDHFKVHPEVLKLAPYEQTSFEIHFTPTSLSDQEEAEIKFSHPKFGEINYYVSGRSTFVGYMKTSRVFTQLNDSGSVSITFRNPFNHPLPIDVQLQEETILPSLSTSRGSGGNKGGGGGTTSPWTLMNKKLSDVVVLPRSGTNVTISFMPTRLCEYNACLVIRSAIGGKQLSWSYPIIGMAEAASLQTLGPMMALCKSSMLREDFIQLHGMVEEDFETTGLNASDFIIDVELDNESQRSLVNRSFRCQVLEIVKSSDEGQNVETNMSKFIDQSTVVKAAPYKLKLQLLFEPLKSFKASVNLIISLKNKGRWKSAVDIFSNDAEPDDNINLVAAVGGVDRVSFKLCNRFLGYSTFQAYFSAKSSPFFSVSPSSGVLAPFGSEGTTLVVSYAPTQFGSRDQGNLIVVTDEAQWTYKVTGRYPENVPSYQVGQGAASLLKRK